MQLLIQTLIVAISVAGSDGQEIFFDPLKRITPCTEGLRGDVDYFTFTGTVGRNFSALISSDWETIVSLEISVSPPNFTKMCAVYIGEGGLFCSRESTLVCYCDRLNTTTGAAHFVVKHPAEPLYSAGVIRAAWSHRNGTVVYSLNNTTLPAIYDENKPGMTLKVNDVPAKQLSSPFGIFFLVNKTNILELCCVYKISPCFAAFSLNGRLFESQGNCVTHKVFVPNLNYTANVALSYSVCTTSGQITAGSGVISTVREVKNATTTEDSFALPESSIADEDSCLPFSCELNLAYTLLFLEILGGVACFFLWLTVFKKDTKGQMPPEVAKLAEAGHRRNLTRNTWAEDTALRQT
ncbi:hypothetical protein BsWGS_16860 [Bradybaena similaris]